MATIIELFNTVLYSDANLIAYYRLSAGGLTTDSKGSYTLTNQNTVAEGTGLFGGCASTGSTNDSTHKLLYSLSDTNLAAGTTTPFTIAGWFKFNAHTNTGGGHAFANFCSNNTFTRFDWHQPSATLRFYRVNEVAQQGPTYSWTPTDGVWYHMAMTYDGTNIRGYLNGSLVGGPTAASGTRTTATTEGLGIFVDGQLFGTLTTRASMDADDVAFFSRALTTAEVSNLYSTLTMGLIGSGVIPTAR